MTSEAVADDVAHRAFLKRLRADLKVAAATLSTAEARYLVDLYYQQQEDRKRSANQTRLTTEPNSLIAWLAEEHKAIEGIIKKAMDAYTDNHLPAKWMKSLVGIGPVLAAGFYATIDITRAKTAGSIWRFAGLDPSRSWLKPEEIRRCLTDVLGPHERGEEIGPADVARVCTASKLTPDTVMRDATFGGRTLTRDGLAKAMARRPFNQRLKTLAWKMSDVQKKFKNHPRSFYGPIYDEYKQRIIQENEAGQFAATAAEKLPTVGKKTEAYKYLVEGKLPPGHLDARALRRTAKIFLSHLHAVMWECHFGTAPPKPYSIMHLDHVHEIAIPNWPMAGEGDGVAGGNGGGEWSDE